MSDRITEGPLVEVVAEEYFMSEGNHNKYWRIFQSDYIVATHYGRIGTQGNITVKHYNSYYDSEMYFDKLIRSKLNKGYHKSIHLTFNIPEELLDATQSTNQTGNGGANKNLAWMFPAFFQAYLNQNSNNYSYADNPMETYIKTPEDAQKIALAAFAGNAPNPATLRYDMETLQILSGITTNHIPTFT